MRFGVPFICCINQFFYLVNLLFPLDSVLDLGQWLLEANLGGENRNLAARVATAGHILGAVRQKICDIPGRLAISSVCYPRGTYGAALLALMVCNVCISLV